MGDAGLMDIRHETVMANGVRLHVARTGEGPPLVLLHGWPEFWLTWEPVMACLADRFSLIAPDLRGFGASEKPDPGPSDQAGPEVHAADILGLLDGLGIERAGLVGHDVGAYVGQALGRRAPERLTGLFFFDCPYPGIGPRLAQPEMLAEIWYQSFHLQPFAAQVVGASREACRAYIGHFLTHWAGGNPHAFDDVLDTFTDNFLVPGNLQGGFNWYLSQQAGRLAMLKGEVPETAPITVPTGIRWGTQDPLFPYAWTDRLGETFAQLDLAPFEGAGHFPHRERPDAAAREIAGFFGRIGT
jgi:pimeloyl-ACP methyl ester carboxylesterase